MAQRYQGWRARRILAEINETNSLNIADDVSDCSIQQPCNNLQKIEVENKKPASQVLGPTSSTELDHDYVKLLELIDNNYESCMISNNFIKKHVSLSDLTSDTQGYAFNNVRSLSAPPSIQFSNPVSESPSILSIKSNTFCPSDKESLSSNTTYCDESDDRCDDFGDINEGRKRRNIRDENSWKKNKAKKLRMLGEEYIGYRKPSGCKAIQDQVCSAKMLGPTCTSSFCQKSKLRGCQRFDDETRKRIHSGKRCIGINVKLTSKVK